MKFSCHVDINAPVDKVVDIFMDPDNLEHVQEGFRSKELISGEAGKEGAVSNMVYEKFDLKETILKSNLPEEFLGLYEHKHMTNTMKVSFEALDDSTTRYHSEIDYTIMKGFILKLLAKLFPGMFKKQVLKWMNLFKDFAEKN
ncbi:SRPBCC family protein [Winogradskyella sp. 3972H.M.0a.05]|uniref:SRPBCC family protein n=1 Tax=Winogradskyella sp. 3972H.M.0a.05 TaxID=2950277 RepID=UPI003397631F